MYVLLIGVPNINRLRVTRILNILESYLLYVWKLLEITEIFKNYNLIEFFRS